MSSDRNVTNHGNMGIKRTDLINVIDIFLVNTRSDTIFLIQNGKKNSKTQISFVFLSDLFCKNRLPGQGELGCCKQKCLLSLSFYSK